MCQVSARLKAARINAGLSKEAVALSLGKSWASITDYESRRVPPVPVLLKLAALYGVTPASLFDEVSADAA